MRRYALYRVPILVLFILEAPPGHWLSQGFFVFGRHCTLSYGHGGVFSRAAHHTVDRRLHPKSECPGSILWPLPLGHRSLRSSRLVIRSCQKGRCFGTVRASLTFANSEPKYQYQRACTPYADTMIRHSWLSSWSCSSNNNNKNTRYPDALIKWTMWAQIMSTHGDWIEPKYTGSHTSFRDGRHAVRYILMCRCAYFFLHV